MPELILLYLLTWQMTQRCVNPVVCVKTNGEVNFSHETQLW